MDTTTTSGNVTQIYIRKRKRGRNDNYDNNQTSSNYNFNLNNNEWNDMKEPINNGNINNKVKMLEYI